MLTCQTEVYLRPLLLLSIEVRQDQGRDIVRAGLLAHQNEEGPLVML